MWSGLNGADQPAYPTLVIHVIMYDAMNDSDSLFKWCTCERYEGFLTVEPAHF
jgi:hypothetical protein